MAISRAFFLSLITELVTRNPNLGIPLLEDGLFANLLISIIYTSVTHAQAHTVLGEACGLPCAACAASLRREGLGMLTGVVTEVGGG